jgi:putative ABC transport system substrate-binding protein
MKRREFIVAFSSAVAWSFGTHAQQTERIRRIGILTSLAENDPEAKSRFGTLVQSLQKLGWVEGRNLQIEYRRGTGGTLRKSLAEELLTTQPDVLIGTSTASLRALQQATNIVPIVFITVSDPVGDGFVASLAQPGGNITGFASTDPQMTGKWYELLKAIAPHVSKVLILFNPTTAPHSLYLEPLEQQAPSFGLEAVPAPVQTSAAIEAAMAMVKDGASWGVLTMPDSFLFIHRDQIANLAARHRVAAIHALRAHVASGGLISYGVDVLAQYAQAAAYIDRLLKGEKPSSLPVQLPNTFETVVNLKTAKALGLEIPASILAQADEIIE